MRVQVPNRPGSGLVAAILIGAMVGGCASVDEPSSSPTTSQTASGPELTPVPTVAATPSPTVLPSPMTLPPVSGDLGPIDGNVLPIAARDGAPGAISCNGLGPFVFETLGLPAGAEDRPGPEFEVLRATIARYGDDPEFALKTATFREVYRDASSVVFLGDRGHPEGPFAHVEASFDGASWKWAGMGGGCRLGGEPGSKWAAANWTLDPVFRKPTSTTRKLHLLVSEVECSPSVPVVGRLAPAFVFYEPGKVRIQVFVLAKQPKGSCDGTKATAVSLTLPESLGSRKPEDVTPEPCRGCGG
jgi:hypothetical protein